MIGTSKLLGWIDEQGGVKINHDPQYKAQQTLNTNREEKNNHQ